MDISLIINKVNVNLFFRFVKKQVYTFCVHVIKKE